MRYDYRRRVHGILTDRTDTATTENVLFDCSDLITATIFVFSISVEILLDLCCGIEITISCCSILCEPDCP